MNTPEWTYTPVYVHNAPVAVYRSCLPDGGTLGPLVFIHGWGLSPRSYRTLIDALAARGYDVYAPALPGFGGSETLEDTGRDTLRRMAHRLLTALQNFGLDGPVPFVAHSLGGGITVHIAEENPGYVSSAVLICPIGGAGANVTTWLHLAGGLRHELFHSPIRRAKDAIPTLLRHPHATAIAGIAAKHADLTDPIITLAHDGVPLAIIAADHDGILPLDRLKQLPGVTYCEVQGSHGWLITHAEECADLTHGMLAAQPAERSDG